jgi:hypothetical protein
MTAPIAHNRNHNQLTVTMAAAGEDFGHPCAKAAPLDQEDAVRTYMMSDFDPSRMTFPASQGWNAEASRGQPAGGRGRGRGAAAGRGGASSGAGGKGRTIYLRHNTSPFRIQCFEGVIQKVSEPGTQEAKVDGPAAPETDEQMVAKFAGKRLNVHIRLNDLELPANASSKAAFEAFFAGWKAVTVNTFLANHGTLFPGEKLAPEGLEPDIAARVARSAAERTYEKKSPVFFQSETSNSYAMRVRVNTQRTLSSRLSFGETSLWLNHGIDTNGNLQAELCHVNHLRKGARVTAVITSGDIWIKDDGEFGHHVNCVQLLITPWSGGGRNNMPSLSVRMPGVSGMMLNMPEEAPHDGPAVTQAPDAAAATADDGAAKKRARPTNQDYQALFDDGEAPSSA